MIDDILHNLYIQRGDIYVALAVALLLATFALFINFLRKIKDVIAKKVTDVGKMAFKEIIRIIILYVFPISLLIYITIDKYNKPYDFKTILTLMIIFTTLTISIMMSTVMIIVGKSIEYMQSQKKLNDAYNKSFDVGFDTMTQLATDVNELKKKLL